MGVLEFIPGKKVPIYMRPRKQRESGSFVIRRPSVGIHEAFSHGITVANELDFLLPTFQPAGARNANVLT